MLHSSQPCIRILPRWATVFGGTSVLRVAAANTALATTVTNIATTSAAQQPLVVQGATARIVQFSGSAASRPKLRNANWSRVAVAQLGNENAVAYFEVTSKIGTYHRLEVSKFFRGQVLAVVTATEQAEYSNLPSQPEPVSQNLANFDLREPDDTLTTTRTAKRRTKRSAMWTNLIHIRICWPMFRWWARKSWRRYRKPPRNDFGGVSWRCLHVVEINYCLLYGNNFSFLDDSILTDLLFFVLLLYAAGAAFFVKGASVEGRPIDEVCTYETPGLWSDSI